MAKPTICLCMIVRDEAHVIARCLESVRPYVDHWLISDTGSVDDTAGVIVATMQGIPGRIVHHKWRDFGHNRTLALREAAKARCDFTLVIDADETLIVDDPAVLGELPHDAYRIEMRFPGLNYPRVNLMRSARAWRFVGVIHEYPACTPPAEEYLLDPAKIYMWTDGDGARGRSGTKGPRDVATLEHAVIDDPGNPRYWFYLAQGYETISRVDDALTAYARRVTMGDYIEEVYYSHLRMGQLCVLKNDWPAAQGHYLDAYQCQPKRAEPLYWLALGHHVRGQDHLALIYLEQATCIDKPLSALFLEPAVYDYLRWSHYVVCLHNAGQADEARTMAGALLDAGTIPPSYQGIVSRIAGRDLPELAAHG